MTSEKTASTTSPKAIWSPIDTGPPPSSCDPDTAASTTSEAVSVITVAPTAVATAVMG